jgi:hypothetical protein
MGNESTCPRCGQRATAKDLKCRSCGARVRYKTAKEAYGRGLGLFDLIPGIRALPFIIRLVLMLVVVCGVVLLVVSRLYG